MANNSPIITSSKTVIAPFISTIFFGLYAALDAVSNAEFVLQKLGINEDVAKFLGSSRGIQGFFWVSSVVLLVSLVYHVRRYERANNKIEHTQSEAKNDPFATPEYDLTPTIDVVTKPIEKEKQEEAVKEVEEKNKEDIQKDNANSLTKFPALAYILLIFALVATVFFALGRVTKTSSNSIIDTNINANTNTSSNFISNVNTNTNTFVNANSNTNTKTFTMNADTKLIEVKNKKFSNQKVVLDGYDYQECTFTNVKFVYNGTAGFGFQHNTTINSFILSSENEAVLLTLYLAKGLGLMKPETILRDENEEPMKNIEPMQRIKTAKP
jgi:hypothetical protein